MRPCNWKLEILGGEVGQVLTLLKAYQLNPSSTIAALPMALLCHLFKALCREIKILVRQNLG